MMHIQVLCSCSRDKCTMTNIYFPDQEITFNDLYFVCYMIERTARAIKQRNNYVVGKMGKDGLARQLSIAETNHCLNPN